MMKNYSRKLTIFVKTNLVYLSTFDRFPSVCCFVIEGLLVLICIFFTASCSTLYSQPLSAFKDGRILPFSQKNKYWFEFQDRQGFLWGTDKNHQVIRFDGYEAKTFSFDPFNADGPQSPGFNRTDDFLLEGSDGRIWRSMTIFGLDRFDPQTGKFEHFQDDMIAVKNASPRSYHFLKEDSGKNLWIGTQSGLYKYSSETEKFSFASVMWHVNFILEDRDGNIWAANPKVGKFIRKIDFEDIRGGEELPFPLVTSSTQASDFGFKPTIITPPGPHHGNLFLISYDGIAYSFDVAARAITPISEGLQPGEEVSTLFNDGISLVGTSLNRVLLYDHEKHIFSPFLELPAIPDAIDPVVNIFRSSDGVLWVVTKERTFQVLPNIGPFKQYRYPNDLRPMLQAGISEPLVLFKKHMYFNTSNGLKPIFEGEAKPIPLEFSDLDFNVPLELTKQYPNRASPKEESGFKFMEDTLRNKLWLLLYQYPYGMKLFSFNENGRKTSQLFCTGRDTCFTDHFSEMDIDPEGRLWMAGWAGVSCFDPEKGQFSNFTQTNGLQDLATLSVLFDKKGFVWIGQNSKGLARYDSKNDCFDYFQNNLADRRSLSTDYSINTLLEDQSGNVWVGTGAGLNRFDRHSNSFESYFEKDGLPSVRIGSLIEDQNNDLWIKTAHNLTKYVPGQNAFYNFDLSASLSKENFEGNIAYQDGKGRLFFSVADGVIYFHPDSVRMDTLVPRLIFTDFQIRGKFVTAGDSTSILAKSIAFTEAVALKFSQNVFSIHYAALEYLYPDKTTYAFQLDGFDPDWRMVGNLREATYTNLSPGEYVFRVKCRNHHGFWGEPITLRITILPPWYRTWIAYLLYTLTGAALLFGISHYELHRQLARAEARRLQELDLVKNRFYTNITHEFRTPLTVINGMADRLQGQVDFAAREGLQLIRRNGRQLLGLVNQILDLAKLESGSLPVNLAQGDVVVFLKYLLESFRSLADDKYITLHFSSTPKRFLMDFDAEKMRQIIGNLLHNAIKFTPEKGKVEVKVAVAGERFRIEVADNGRGIPPEQLDRIFDRFHQVDGSATRSGEGTGIGLTLTRELVKLLGGDISVESGVGSGSTFTVLLPVSQQAAAYMPGILQHPDLPSFQNLPNQKPETLKTGWTKIEKLSNQKPVLLIIEDNPDVVRYITLVLQNRYQLLTATDGKSGLEMARAKTPDLILSDVMMPEMDGYEVCRSLKRDPATSHIPVVMLTAKADFDSRMEGLEGGAEAYLAKPFEERELLTVLRKLLENRELLRRHYTSGEFVCGVARPVSTLSANRSEEKANSRDEQFLNEVLEMVNAHLHDTGLTAEGLADLLHVSYNQLFRKTKALTGMGVTEYVRHIRLHKAARLLLERKELSISQVAQIVGFNHPGFFSREFKKVMGVPPKQYREQQG